MCLDTSDVQGVCGVVDGQEGLALSCWFAEGSDAVGCQVSLVPDDTDAGVHPTITADLMREPSTATQATGRMDVSTGWLCNGYPLLYAQDIESDGSIGDLRIAGNLSTPDTFCGPFTNTSIKGLPSLTSICCLMKLSRCKFRFTLCGYTNQQCCWLTVSLDGGVCGCGYHHLL